MSWIPIVIDTGCNRSQNHHNLWPKTKWFRLKVADTQSYRYPNDRYLKWADIQSGPYFFGFLYSCIQAFHQLMSYTRDHCTSHEIAI